jgi:tripeptidyl-peptidase-1
VSQANDLFAAQFEVYSHPSMSNTITRTLSVSLPQELVGHVQVIHPTTAFVKPGGRMGSMIEHVQHNKRAPSCNTSLPDGIMTPACLQSIYGIPTTPATQSNNALLVTAYQDEFAQTADLEVGVAGEFLQLLNLAHVRRNSSKACVRIWTPLRRSRC